MHKPESGTTHFRGAVVVAALIVSVQRKLAPARVQHVLRHAGSHAMRWLDARRERSERIGTGSLS